MVLRYVAIGDSTTEGLEDPDDAGGYRGWANRFAEHLAAAHGPIEYANLAIRGSETRQILDHQLPRAVAMRPQVTTVVAGTNDVLRRRFDLDQVAGDQARMIHALKDVGATVLTFTMPDLSDVMPAARLVRSRLAALNQRLRETARETGALLVDLEAHPVGADPRLWHEDRLHANSMGHERIAAGLAHVYGLPGHERWHAPLPLAPPRRLWERTREEARWIRRYLVPWLSRRVRGVSSADGRVAKRPEPHRFPL